MSNVGIHKLEKHEYIQFQSVLKFANRFSGFSNISSHFLSVFLEIDALQGYIPTLDSDSGDRKI